MLETTAKIRLTTNGSFSLTIPKIIAINFGAEKDQEVKIKYNPRKKELIIKKK